MQYIGKYNVIKKLGSGSFGCVYLAEDPKLHLQVAIKVFKIKDVNLMNQVTSATEDPEQVIKQRFINEARTLRKLSTNPYIIEMYEFDELSDGTPYYVMPFVERTLVDEIGKDAFNQGMLDELPKVHLPRRIPTPLAINYLKQLTQALCAVHSHGLIHRDIKPENILLTDENQLQLSDFGIAKLPLTDDSQTGFGMGSKNYLSPEQQESAKHVKASSDIYSLGVIAYRMFTGQLPVGRFQDPIIFAPDMSKALNNLIILSLSQMPSQRPCDGNQFLIALNLAIAESSPETDQIQTNQTIVDNTQTGTVIWTAQSESQIKEELKPLENKIIELLVLQGEIKADNLILLQTIADMAHIDDSALQVFISQVTLQQATLQQATQHQNNRQKIPEQQGELSNNNGDDLPAFISWVSTVNKSFNSDANKHTQFLSDKQIESLIAAGLSTTNKTADQLKALIDAKQQKLTLVEQIKATLFNFFALIKKRPTLFTSVTVLTVIIGLTLLYGQNEVQKKLKTIDDNAWIKAQKVNTVVAYELYLINQPEGNYLNDAKQALAQQLQQTDKSIKNEVIARKQIITAIQQELIKQGYQISKTGKLDVRTKHAIESFEKNHNLLITGEVDKLILKKLQQSHQNQDEKLWLEVQDKNLITDYQQYKDAFPQGQHSMQATQIIQQLTLAKSNNEKQRQQDKIARDKQVIELVASDLLNDMITLPAATFMMGCTLDEECKAKERPQHRVSISTFSIMATEVTFNQWDTCVISGACKVRPKDEGWGRGNRPVIGISYREITTEFIPWLNTVTNINFSLPSEAQWEYAAKAMSMSKYAWGNRLDCVQAQYSQFSGLCGNDRKTATVKSFPPNTFGLYDMHGNVWEWTQDCWNDNYNASPTDGSAWETGDCSAGVIRGGSWLNEAKLLRSTFRSGYSRSTKSNVNGFRLVINTK